MTIAVPGTTGLSLRTRRWPVVLVGLLCLLVSGCGGCRDDSAKDAAKKDDQKTEKEKADEKPKEAFEVKPLVLYPGQFSDEARLNRYKPGHLATASLRVKSNKSDVNGRLLAHNVSAGTKPVGIIGTGMYIDSARPVTLAKEEEKNLETLVYLPHRETATASVVVRAQMLAPSGLPMVDTSGGANSLKAWQYHMVVLSSQPDQLKYLQMMDCIQIPAFDYTPPPAFYHLVYPTAGDAVPLSSSSLAWTTIAYLVWDGYDPELLEEAQKQAMLDWLHFGGQLVINGPGSLSRLQGSFLDSWLPATEGLSRNITSEDLREFNKAWAVPSESRASRLHALEIPENFPMLGIEFNPRPEGKEVAGTDGLVYERPVGRGRIVVCGFSLRDPRLRRWGGVASFFNSALLRKPSRHFARGPDDQVSFSWKAGIETFDMSIGSNLRYLVRDLDSPLSDSSDVTDEPSPSALYYGRSYSSNQADNQDDNVEAFRRPGTANRFFDARFADGTRGQSDSGVAGWNDDHGLAEAARRTITQSAGIRPPSRQFVIQMLAAYLFVLVPLNWLVFRLIGRVEWAWIAAPLIAIIAAFSVVRMASLDIGFARSQTVVGVLEMHADYPRAHLAEYSALYTSLSTRYAIEFDDTTGVAMPFRGTGAGENPNAPVPVTLERTITNRMTGFPVKSNSTRSLHLETMIDTGGMIQLTNMETGEPQILNGTRFTVANAGIVRKNSSGSLEVAWLGDFPAGEAMAVRFHPVTNDRLYNSWSGAVGFVSFEKYCRRLWESAVPEDDSVTLEKALEISGLEGQKRIGFQEFLIRQFENSQTNIPFDTNDLLIGFSAFSAAYELFGPDEARAGAGLGEVFDTVSNWYSLGPGQSRLIGEIKGPVGTHQLKPEATQKSQSTLLIVHLQPAELPIAKPDDNALVDFLAKPDQDRWLKEIEDMNKPDSEPKNDLDPDTTGDDVGN